jgi:hypothetical protein
MATKPDSEGTSGAELLRKAEEYVKNPTKMADFTKEREAKERTARATCLPRVPLFRLSKIPNSLRRAFISQRIRRLTPLPRGTLMQRKTTFMRNTARILSISRRFRPSAQVQLPRPNNLTSGWSSPAARQAHNLKVVGSNPTPETSQRTSLISTFAPVKIEGAKPPACAN